MGSGSASGEDRAREAAEAAISSPLLEDIDLSGARGILVNVTAGMDLAIGEFQQVGETVKQCASDDATVVIGTVIDPEMNNTIRVTVVATGLGQPLKQQKAPPDIQVVTTTRPAAGAGAGGQEAPNWQRYERPTSIRQQASGDGLVPPAEPSFDLLDIPAFLRRQAD
jgi:cell division protein FtsZ